MRQEAQDGNGSPHLFLAHRAHLELQCHEGIGGGAGPNAGLVCCGHWQIHLIAEHRRGHVALVHIVQMLEHL